MTENPHDAQPARTTRAIGWQGLACLGAMAALTVAGCSSTAGSTAVRATPDTPAPSVSTLAPITASAPIPTVTQAPATTVTVTAAPPPTPTQTVVVQSAGPRAFHSPSGNVNCTLSTPGGEDAARCEVVDHTWAAPPPPPDCHLDSGDRFYLTQGGSAVVGCYGQEFPTSQQTLGYGQSLSLGTITCASEYTGMTCTDSSTGHYFTVSRDGYELG
jgi:hypothetical protein